jgi:hypothetical protein
VAEHRGGGVGDPTPYLEQLSGVDRTELSALIDRYLARFQGEPFDPDAYAGSASERLVESVYESLAGESGSWPVLLPQLRNQAKIKRAGLVERLTEALGASGQEEKVAYYYNQMEHGRLEPQRVSDRVLDALAEIVNTTRETLRRAGETVGPTSTDSVFARVAPGSKGMDLPAAAESPDRAPEAEAFSDERDEIDALFLGD